MLGITRTVPGLARVAAVLVLPAALLIATATAASAGACETSAPGGNGGSSFCTGVRTHKVFLTCEENSGNHYFRIGPEVGPGQFSRARCDEFSFVSDITVSFT